MDFSSDMAFVIRLVLSLLLVCLVAVIFMRICAKAGYPAALGLLFLVPLVNFVMLLYLAFARWPIEREFHLFKLTHLQKTSPGEEQRRDEAIEASLTSMQRRDNVRKTD
jgi:hypothetical protein